MEVGCLMMFTLKSILTEIVFEREALASSREEPWSFLSHELFQDVPAMVNSKLCFKATLISH